MTESGAAETLDAEVALLERAVSYTLGRLRDVTSDALTRPSPCRDWDLRALLEHMNDSLAALQEASDLGQVALGPVPCNADPATNLVAALRSRACALLGAWVSTGAAGTGASATGPARTGSAGTGSAGGAAIVSVGGIPAPIALVAAAGAVEIAVHGWDVGQASGHPRPIPADLAAELLWLVPEVVTAADRPVRFAEPVRLPAGSGASDRLVAYLGRHPGSQPGS